MSRPPLVITPEQVMDIAFRTATGETLRSMANATGLTSYYVKKIINHASFELLLADARKQIAAARSVLRKQVGA